MSFKIKQNQYSRDAKIRSRRLLCGASVVAAAIALAVTPAHAQDRYWDANGTAVGSGGTGTWSLADLTWSPSNDGVSGPYNLPWDNAALANAIFGGTAGTVTVSAPVTVGNISFNTAGYTLNGSTLTLGGANSTIAVNAGNSTINSIVAGLNGLIKTGSGGLILNGVNSFTGNIIINGGSLYAGADGALGAAGNNIFTAAGANVRLSIGGANTARTVTIGTGGNLILEGTGAGAARIRGDGSVQLAPNGITMSNDLSDYTGRTVFQGCNGVCSARFTSIADLGVASSLGAPVTVADGTIVFNQQSQYSDSIIYLGDGDSSNRNWDINGNGANIRNQGTGTLQITGDIDISVNGAFNAETADIHLLGVLSGGAFGFNASTGRYILLGNANVFSGQTNLVGEIRLGKLSDIGSASSLGAGTTISLSNGTLSYNGTGDASNREWLINGATNAIRNDGTGALNLSGTLAFNVATPNPDTLTLGGSFAGASTFSGVMSGTGNLIVDSAGTWILSGANSQRGTVTVSNGTLRAGSADAFGAATGFIVNGGSLDLGGFDLVAPSLTGSGGTVALGAQTLTVDAKTTQVFGGSITGSGGLRKTSAGSLSLTGVNSYTGATTIGGGRLGIDFSGAGGPASNIVSASSALVLSGGTIEVVGAAGEANSQTFNGLTINAGSNTILASSGAGGSVNLNLGAITRAGGLVNFVLPASGAITTSNADGVLGGWATINGSDYAKVVGGGIIAFDASDYTTKDDAATWSNGDIVSDTANAADTPFFDTVTGNVQLGGLRYTAAATADVTIDNASTLGVDGTIIVAPSTLATNQSITGGSLTGGAGGGTLGVQHNGTGTLTIGSTIVDNGGTTGFTKSGGGTVRLTGTNSYTGGTTLSGGRLEITELASGGIASSIGASNADAANLVLESGTLAYVGGTDAVSDRGITLVNGGADRAIEINTGRSVEFSGLVTSPDDAGLTKTGAGTLVLSNTANDYVGVTTITQAGSGASTLSVNTLSNGDVASGIGAASSASANLVMSNGGRLQYTGGTVAIDRGFTLAAGQGGIDVANAGTTLTISGVATGSGTLVKHGDGVLVLGGANNYTGDTVVTGGTLRAGSAQAFGAGAHYMTVNTGAKLELSGYNINVAALVGGGLVDLGGNTLTTAGGPGTFTGRITGTGGFTRGAGSYTQTISGCNNDYTGATTISGGLSVDCIANGGQASSIGASSSASPNLALAGGTLSYTGTSVSTDRGFAMSGNGAINVVNASTVLAFSGAVTGGGGLNKDGAGTLLLSGNNSSTGNVRVFNGTLRAGSTTALGSGWLTLDNAASVLLDLDGYSNNVAALAGGGALGGNISLGSATLTINTGGNLAAANFGGAITGGGELIKNGGSTQQLSGCTSSYDGTTVINAGILAVACLDDGGLASSIGDSSSAATNLVLSGGTLQYIGTGGATNRQFTLGASTTSKLDASGTGAIEFTHAGPLTFASANTAQTLNLGGTNTANNIFAAQITNNGTGITRLTKSDAGTWVLTNAGSTYTGVTTINGGVLAVDKLSNGGLASSIGASSAAAANLVIGNGSTLRYTGAGDTTNRLFTLSAGVTFIESSGTGAIVFTDTGAVTLQGNNQARTIALGGTNTGDNTLGGSIGNAGSGLTTLAKNDSGTWVLTGNHSYTGSTNINDGLLSIGNGGTTGSIVSATVNNFGTLAFNRSDSLAFGGAIVGTGALRQNGAGTTILTGTSTYTGGTTIAGGTLQIGNGGATGSILGDVINDGLFTFNRSDSLTFGGIISGGGAVRQIGSGTTVLTGANSYAGGTSILAGILQVSADANLGAAAGPLSFSGGTLRTTASFASARTVDLVGAGTILTDAGTTFSLDGTVSGAGGLIKSGAGTLVLTGSNSYAGGTTISTGILQLGNGGTSGSILGNVANNGSLAFFRSDDISFSGVVTGTGSLVKNGAGVLNLTANNSYSGATTVNTGTLLINGNQSAATGLVAVSSGATLGGSGRIGGSVNVASGGILAPGNSPGTLTIDGDLLLSSGSVLNFEFGQADVAGGPLNDLVNVGGNLRLDGTLNINVSAGGTFGGGIYRLFNYGGALTDDGLTLGLVPGGSSVVVQTSVAGQVNLINSVGLSQSFWDGDAGPKFDNVINGGNGTWHLAGVDNDWTNADGSVNAAYANGTLAIFAGASGTVTVDNGAGAVTASGLQFASNGYVINGQPLTLVGPESAIRVGDGSAAGAGYIATIAAELTGAAKLTKTDAGTLILSGTNSYTGGTALNGGTLQIYADANLGAAGSGLSFNGGTLRVMTNFTATRDVELVGAGTITTATGVDWTLAGNTSGAGSLTINTANVVTLTGNAAHSGTTTVNGAGTLQIGDGGTSGAIAGDIIDNATVRFNRSDATIYAGSITGTGSFSQTGSGTLSLTGNSSWAGTANIAGSGGLRVASSNTVSAANQTSISQGSTLTVSGAGSVWSTGFGNVNSGDGSATLKVENGGIFRATSSGLTLRAAAGAPGYSILNVTGAGSLVDLSGGMTVASTSTASVADVTISNGGTVRSGALNVIGALAGNTTTSTVTITGSGSNWTSTGGTLLMRNGQFSILDGAAASFNTALFGTISQGANALVSGAGSSLKTAGLLTVGSTTGSGVLTIADGALVTAGGGLALAVDAGTSGVINIGGVSGGAAAAAGSIDGAITFGPGTGELNFNHIETDYQFASAISGAGTINHEAGVTHLTGDSSAFAGTTSVTGGRLLVDNVLGDSTSLVTVTSGSILGGIGTIGGDVELFDGNLNPGDVDGTPGALAVRGDLTLASTSTLNVDLGQANVVGGPLNDLLDVGGDLVLDGTLNIQTSAGGSFDPGIYRIINYTGLLTDSGLTIGTIPSSDFYVQTSIANQVNLVNTSGLQFRYWDGAGAKNDGVIEGGNGLWQNFTGNDNWVDDGSIPNAPFADSAFAVFMGAAGNVTVDRSLGDVNVAGMQFVTDGYTIQGDAITLTGTQATIRVGDGTTAGAGMTAIIAAELTGTAQLTKSDIGTLILSGTNSYTGGTAINGGVLQVSADANLGDSSGGLTFNGGTLQTTADLDSARAVALTASGTLLTDGRTTLSLEGTISGTGSLSKDGAGTLILTGSNSYSGDTLINSGALFVNGDATAATGLTSAAAGTTLGGTGVIGGNVVIAAGATLDPGGIAGLPGQLTINGDLRLEAGAMLAMQFGEANVAGGALNDIIEVGGNLTLDGTLNVAVPAGGDFGPGIYRLFNYGGTLTNNGLAFGAMPSGSTSTVQTAIAGQVNLVNTDGLLLNFWDGAGGPKFNGAVDGGQGVWQNGTGNDNWTDAGGVVNAAYADGTFAIFGGTGGNVTIDNSLGAVAASGMQFAAEGYTIDGEALTLTGPQATIRVGDGSAAGAAFTTTIAAELTGNAQLRKTDAGKLILSGNNSYTGGTVIEGGTLTISADSNLGDAAGGVSINGGVLQTSANLTSDRSFVFAGAGTVLTDHGTTFTLNGPLSGTGVFTKGGEGTLRLSGDSSGYVSVVNVSGGVLAVDGKLGSTVSVAAAGRLEGTGQVGGVTNTGVVAPGRNGVGALTITGDYVGNGGTLAIEAALGGDGSETSRLIVNGGTSGATTVKVTNRGGPGGQTIEGIKIVDVAGASNGSFTLDGDFVFQGQQAVIVGAYGYRLYQGSVTNPTDGDWYLRSSLTDPTGPGGPVDPGEPTTPLYQPGVPLYENLAQALLSLNGLPTLQQRVGNRSWAPDVTLAGTGVWGRMEGAHHRSNAVFSTSGSGRRVDNWKLQMGADAALAEREDGATLIGGITAHYGQADTGVRSMFGNGTIEAKGYGVGATLTWYGPEGFYVDGQTQLSWFKTDLKSDVLGSLGRHIDGRGQSASVELGKRSSVGDKLTLTPQMQMVYSHVGFDRFLDPTGTAISSNRSESLKSRGGLSLDYQSRADETAFGKARSTHLYGLVNLNYEWLDGTQVDVSGTPLINLDYRMTGELGLGASVNWNDRITIYAEGSGETALRDFGRSYSLRGTVGIRIGF